MGRFWWLSCCLVLQCWIRTSTGEPNYCSLEQCDSEHRTCLLVATNSTNTTTADNVTGTTTQEDEEYLCGPCLPGFIEWNRTLRDEGLSCLNVSSVSLQDYLATYQPVYRDDDSATQADTTTNRLQLLFDSIQFIQDYYETATTLPYELGLTPYSADDPTFEYEQRAGYFYVNLTGTSDDLRRAPTPTIAKADLPTKVDWVAQGAVTSVKDQGRCGGCWATSLAAAVESAAYIQNNGYFQSLSFQQYISCNKRNLGCEGGNLIVGMGYTALNRFGGMSRMNDYPFTDYRGKTTEECLLNENNNVNDEEENADQEIPLAVEISRPRIAFDTVPVVSFELRLQQVKQILAQQPIAMVMKSSCRTFSNYRSGVLTDDGDCSCDDPYCADHAILMVGYDDTAEIPHFVLKNSWGTRWGEDGYFRVAQTEKGPYGLFGILSHGVIPGTVSNVTAAVEEVEQDTPLPVWAILAIVVACMVGCLCILELCASIRPVKQSGG